jgi:hypothetical protein
VGMVIVGELGLEGVWSVDMNKIRPTNWLTSMAQSNIVDLQLMETSLVV